MLRTLTSLSILLIAGCTTPAQNDTALGDSVAALLEQVQSLDTKVSAELASQAESADAARRTNSAQLKAVNKSIEGIRSDIEQACTIPAGNVEQCETQTVVMYGERMVVGEKENVRIVPPGFVLAARVDTGAASSSLHAENLTEFERDGKNWVRFDLGNDEVEVSIEKPVVKYVRVFQQSDKKGSRRPVIRLRIVIGNIKDTFEFTLADRSHLEHNMLLGRNFLTDIALVDVGRQFVQPLPKP